MAPEWEFGAGVRSLALGSIFYHALHLPNHEPSISYPTHSPMQPQVPIPILIGMGTEWFLALGVNFSLDLSLALGWKFGAGMEVWR